MSRVRDPFALMPREHKKWQSGSRSIVKIGTLLTGDMESSAHSLGDPDGDGEVQTPSTRRRPGSSSLGLGLAKAFERVSLLVVWAWTTHFSFPTKISRVLCGFYEHQRRVQFEGRVAEPLRTITAILPGSKWSRLLLRVVLQDPLREVTQIYFLFKLRVFVDDITALLMGQIWKWLKQQRR